MPRLRHEGFTLVEILIAVTILGILAAVAIPSFIKHVRRGKTSEALMSLARIYDGAVAYYEAEHSDRNGRVLRKEFPRHSGCNPPAGMDCCIRVPEEVPRGKPVRTTEQEWGRSLCWRALNFSISDPQYYQYQYRKQGFEKDSNFTARARGDLNGDGIYSTFELVGSVDAQGNPTKGSGIYKWMPLE